MPAVHTPEAQAWDAGPELGGPGGLYTHAVSSCTLHLPAGVRSPAPRETGGPGGGEGRARWCPLLTLRPVRHPAGPGGSPPPRAHRGAQREQHLATGKAPASGPGRARVGGFLPRTGQGPSTRRGASPPQGPCEPGPRPRPHLGRSVSQPLLEPGACGSVGAGKTAAGPGPLPTGLARPQRGGRVSDEEATRAPSPVRWCRATSSGRALPPGCD